MKNFKIIFACIFAMGLSVSMNAQESTITNDNVDYSRKGVFVNLGLGGSLVKQKITYDGIQSQTDNSLALLGDLSVGIGFTEQIVGFLSLKQNWYTLEDEIDKEKTAFEFIGVGGSYFFKPTAKSAFVTAGIGIASQAIDLEANIDMDGLGIFLGLGYYINHSINVKVDAIWGNPGVEIFDERFAINTVTIGATINYTFSKNSNFR